MHILEFIDFEILQQLVWALVPIIAIIVWRILDRFNITTYIKAKERLAMIAWRAAIEAADLYGWSLERIKQEAAVSLTRLAKEHGLKVTKEQVRELISSAYDKWIDVWEEEWEEIED